MHLDISLASVVCVGGVCILPVAVSITENAEIPFWRDRQQPIIFGESFCNTFTHNSFIGC